MRQFKSAGTICVRGPFSLVYALCDLEYQLDESGSFIYTFTPNYSVIDLLTTDYFQGIPGLNLDLKKQEYIRENQTPTFIAERVPSENREDYYDLLSRANLDFMDPIKYLINTSEQYSGDELFVINKHQKEVVSFKDFCGHNTNASLIKKILLNICLGNDITINNQTINDENRKIFYDVLLALYSRSFKTQKESQKEGVEKAKLNGAYKGRKPVKVDTMLFLEMLEKVSNKEINAKEASAKLGISIDKFYRLKKLQK